MTCSICATIPDVASANTGRDVYFQAPITSLKPNRIGSREDLWDCPECGAVFSWRDDSSQSGSGNNDEEVLTRLPSAQSSVIRAFLHRGERAASEIARDGDKLLAVPATERDLVFTHLHAHDRELGCQLLPYLLEAIAQGGDEGLSYFVSNLASGPEAARVQSELSRAPSHPSLDPLRLKCRQTLCTTCKPPEQLRRENGIDAWFCPDCDAGFAWRSPRVGKPYLARLVEYEADALRACLRRSGTVPTNAIEMVFASDDRRNVKIVLAHGLLHDRELVRQLVPRAVRELASGSKEWLRDQLIAFVAEPSDAAIVLEAIEKAPQSSPLVDALAAHCRQVRERASRTPPTS